MVQGKTGVEAHNLAYEYEAKGYSLHFHVWTGETFLAFLSEIIGRYSLPLRLLAALQNGAEMVVVLRRKS